MDSGISALPISKKARYGSDCNSAHSSNPLFGYRLIEDLFATRPAKRGRSEISAWFPDRRAPASARI